jgi:hypothetical protein
MAVVVRGADRLLIARILRILIKEFLPTYIWYAWCLRYVSNLSRTAPPLHRFFFLL